MEFESDQTAVDLLGDLLAGENADRMPTLVIGAWSGELYDHSPAEILEALVAAADRLPNLRALFLGDMARKKTKSPGFTRPTSRPSGKRFHGWKSSASAGATA